MKNYLQNALAFVFVIDISNSGGFQDDRVIYQFVLLNVLTIETVFNPKTSIYDGNSRRLLRAIRNFVIC